MTPTLVSTPTLTSAEKVVTPTNVETPETLICFVKKLWLVTVENPAKVETPVTFN